jgi:hypothetical protein
MPDGSEKHTESSYLPGFASHFFDTLVERFGAEKHVQRNRFILLLLTTSLLTLLIIPSQHFISTTYRAGDIATSDIRATRDYLLEDRTLTEQKRTEAAVSSPHIYDYSPAAANEVTRRFADALQLLKSDTSAKFTAEAGRAELERIFGFSLSEEEVDALRRVRAERPLLSEVSRLANRFYAKMSVADRKAFDEDRLHSVHLLTVDTGRQVPLPDAGDYLDAETLRQEIGHIPHLAGLSDRDVTLLNGILSKALVPNVTYNAEATERKRAESRDAVSSALYQIKRGEMIVRVGERVTPEQASKLATVAEKRTGFNRLFMVAGIFILVLLFFYFPYRFALKNIRKFSLSSKDLLLLSLVALSSFLVLKLALVVSTAMGGAFPAIDTRNYFYLFPFAAAPMIIRIILNSEVALVYCAISAPLLGIMFDSSIIVVLYSLLGGVVGAHGVRQCQDRGTIYQAGLKLCVVNVAMALSFQLLNDTLLSVQTLYCLGFALAGGVVNAAVTMGVIPVIEAFFQYTTDIKLLEFTNLHAPLLRELMIKAPGTYHHSVVVGSMAESAAEAIHANPLLARVASYYHDIGKLGKPQYFIENAVSAENRHDRLSPSMSALILTSHVKEGVELAREHHLGRPIIDIIRQSHGTALITFFYQKAKSMADPEVQQINERDFRYPGPKPQTREAGLVMLADCVEAASRTLADPTPARIQGMVQKIINNIFIDGQLDECELTLKNLHEIARSFNRILCGIHHQRIDYPEPAFKERKGKNGEDSTKEHPAAPPDRGAEAPKSSGDDIKRLGIS